MNAGISFLRRGAQKVAETKKGGSKGGFYLKWKPPQKPPNSQYPVAEPFIFLDAAYPDPWNLDPTTGQPSLQPGYHFREHNFRFGPKDFRSLICSAGADPHAALPCVGDAASQGHKGTEARDQWGFNVAHLMPYHLIPWVKDVNGQGVIQYKKDTQEPIRIQEQCKGRGCEYCQKGEPFKFGSQRILTVGSGHLQTVLGWNDKVGMYCVNCQTTIALLQFACLHCHQPILDVASCGYNNQQLAEFARSETRCQYCNQRGLPQEIIDCGYDPRGVQKLQQTCQVINEQGQTVPGTRRFSIFDCVFYAQREGEKKDTKLVEVNWCPKWQFPVPDQRAIDDLLKDIAPAPLDLPAIFAPLSLDEQAAKLNMQNPFAQYNQPAPQQYAQLYNQQAPQSPYGGPQAQQGYPNQQTGQPYVPPQQPQAAPQYPAQPQQPYQQPQQAPYQQPYGQPQQPQAQPQFGQQPHPQANVPGPGRPPYGR